MWKHHGSIFDAKCNHLKLKTLVSGDCQHLERGQQALNSSKAECSLDVGIPWLWGLSFLVWMGLHHCNYGQLLGLSGLTTHLKIRLQGVPSHYPCCAPVIPISAPAALLTLVISHMDYCNMLYLGLPLKSIQKLQLK